LAGKLASDKATINIEFPVDNPFLPIRVRFDGLILRIPDHHLILNPETSDAATLARVHGVAQKILTELPHTPVAAIGINFAFSERPPSEAIMGIFRAPDTSRLAAAGLTQRSISVSRELHYDGHTLNLVIGLDTDDTAKMEFNFHSDVPDASAALAFLDSNTMVELESKARAILSEVYSTPDSITR
jgi:hypothetical protein